MYIYIAVDFVILAGGQIDRLRLLYTLLRNFGYFDIGNSCDNFIAYTRGHIIMLFQL